MERTVRYSNGRQAVYQNGRVVSRTNYVYGNTVTDINRVLDEEPRRRPDVATRKQSDRAKNMNLPYVLFLVCAMAVAVVVIASYIQANAEVTASVRNIGALESQYLNLKTDNDEAYSRIVNAVDLDEVRRIAQEELGMHYALEGQIITYTDTIGDYVKQYSDIE
ncbi:MAG: cell division protein FtsL [Lachnospiraceae bacterium]|nr:cell division protein FtsL [Lachnospiraceae bacterium]